MGLLYIYILKYQFKTIIYNYRSNPFIGFLFLVSMCILFPFCISSDLILLSTIGSGLLWLCVLVSCMFSLEKMFHEDVEDHSLDLLIMSSVFLPIYIIIHVTMYWLFLGIPLLISIPIISLFFSISLDSLIVLTINLYLATLSIHFFGSFASIMTLGYKQRNSLITLILVPLCLPIIIFGSNIENDLGLYVINSSTIFLGNLALIAVIFNLFTSNYIFMSYFKEK